MRILALLLWGMLWPLAGFSQELVITFGGDVNFAQSRARPRPDSVFKYARYDLDFTTEFLRHELTGDLNFINVETVVSERDGASLGKTFVFRSHPESFRTLMDLGVNAFSLANNHAYDHGWQGMADTLAFFEDEAAARVDQPLLFAGVGSGEAAFAPRIIEVQGYRIALSAIGIGAAGYAAGQGPRVGMAMLRVPGQYDRTLAAMAAADADLKILSIHTGTENQVALDWNQRDQFRRAVEDAGVHLVLGHHPHVPRAVEVGEDHAIFYSLGNLLFVGGAVRDGLPVGQDYGLFGKAYFQMTAQGPRLSALEAVPLRQVHLRPSPMDERRAALTMQHLSRISRVAAGVAGAEFTPIGGPAPRGAACYGEPYGAQANALCCMVEHTMACDLPDLM